MRRCKKCGTMLNDDARDCSVCGEVSKGQDNFSDVTTTLSPNNADDNIGMLFKRKRTLILLSIFLGFLGASWFYLGKKIHGLITVVGALLIITGCLAYGLSINNNLDLIYYFVLVLIPIFSINTGFCLYFIILGKVTDDKGLLLK